MDWYVPCAYAGAQKRRFHTTARARLKALADALGFAPGSFDLRSNQGGIAVSGGRNHFAPLRALDDPQALAARVRQVMNER